MFDVYRQIRVENAYLDRKTPSVIVNMQLNKLSADEKEQAQIEAQKDIESLRCGTCEHGKICNYRNLPTRFPELVEGGRGLCLRYFMERENGRGFMQRNGEPFMLTSDAIEALKLSE